jgi:hypothetical protein
MLQECIVDRPALDRVEGILYVELEDNPIGIRTLKNEVLERHGNQLTGVLSPEGGLCRVQGGKKRLCGGHPDERLLGHTA